MTSLGRIAHARILCNTIMEKCSSILRDQGMRPYALQIQTLTNRVLFTLSQMEDVERMKRGDDEIAEETKDRR